MPLATLTCLGMAIALSALTCTPEVPPPIGGDLGDAMAGVDRGVSQSDAIIGGGRGGSGGGTLDAGMDAATGGGGAGGGTGGGAGGTASGGTGGRGGAGGGAPDALPQCDLVAQDCAANLACYPSARTSGATECLPAGELSIGQCLEDTDCGRGYVCEMAGGAALACLELCDPTRKPCRQNRPCVPIPGHSPVGYCDL